MGAITPGYRALETFARRGRSPIGAHLQVADRCNHKCRHCYQVQGQKGELSLSELRAVLDDLALSGVMMLNVSGGEATLRADLPDILRYARSKGFAIRLFTNAYVIDDDLADAIASIGVLEVHVSVYSDRDAEHDAITQVPGSLARTIGGIRRLRARDVRVTMKTPMTSVAPGARARVERLALELGCAHVASPQMTPREDGTLDPFAVQPSPEQLVADGAVDPWLPPENGELNRGRKLESGSCGVCTSSVAVMPNGEVRPCTDTLVPLGNLLRQPLREVLKRPDAVFLQETKWRDVHGCRDCDLLLACGRCHASAAVEGGDYLGPYASACTGARTRYEAGLGRAVEIREPLAAACVSRRDVGPYRIVAPGILEVIPDVVTETDEARSRRFAWIRPHVGYAASRLAGATPMPGTLEHAREAVPGVLAGSPSRMPPRTDF